MKALLARDRVLDTELGGIVDPKIMNAAYGDLEHIPGRYVQVVKPQRVRVRWNSPKFSATFETLLFEHRIPNLYSIERSLAASHYMRVR